MMKKGLEFMSFFVYSEIAEKCFYTDFSSGMNVVVGRNTSGKSTLLQCLLYTIGINDNKNLLNDLLDENVTLRLDCKITGLDGQRTVTFVRDNSIIVIKDGYSKRRYNGIDGDSSVEHIELKRYISELFGFNLKLEHKGELKEAPIETMFLPYFVAQSVGWVYLRKSFSNLDYYKNFKDDYLDYYLGIVSPEDRVKKTDIEKKLEHTRSELKFFQTLKNEDTTLSSSYLIDEEYTAEAYKYLEDYNVKKEELKKLELEYTKLCNQLMLLQQRKTVLRRVATNHRKQNPIDGECPTCNRKLDFNLADIYVHYQSASDTQKQKAKYTGKIKDVQSKKNSQSKKIKKCQEEIKQRYEVLKEYQKFNVSYGDWIETKAISKLGDKVLVKITMLLAEEERLIKALSAFKTDKEVEEIRLKKRRLLKKYLIII